jgi:hypothetical protein
MNSLTALKSITDIKLDEIDDKIIWHLYDVGMQFRVRPHRVGTSIAKLVYENLHKNKYSIELTDNGYCRLCDAKSNHQYCTHNLKVRLCNECANWIVYEVNTFTVCGYKIIFATAHKLIAIKIIDDRIKEFDIITRSFPPGVLRLYTLTTNVDCSICGNQTPEYNPDYHMCEKCAKFPLEMRSRIIFKCMLLIDIIPANVTFLICNCIIDIYDAIFYSNWY